MRTHWLCLFLLFAVSQQAFGAMATFDDLEEGFYGYELTDGGITFYDVIYGDTPAVLAIDDASATMPLIPEWEPFFSSPNVLGMGTLNEGPTYSPSGFGELKMTTGRIENFAQVDVFHHDGVYSLGDAILLEAYLADVLVAYDSHLIGSLGYRHDLVTISGVEFDTLRLTVVDYDVNYPDFGAAIDNVIITPEPSSLLLIALPAIAAITRRR